MVRDELVSIGRMADARDVDVVGVFVESAFLGPSAKVAIEHARWIGSVEAIAWRVFGYALIEMVSPREWRQILGITGKGKEPVRAWGEGQWPELATPQPRRDRRGRHRVRRTTEGGGGGVTSNYWMAAAFLVMAAWLLASGRGR
jgi:hypothetical protein